MIPRTRADGAGERRPPPPQAPGMRKGRGNRETNYAGEIIKIAEARGIKTSHKEQEIETQGEGGEAQGLKYGRFVYA